MMIKGRHEAMQRQMKRLFDRERQAKLVRALDAHMLWKQEKGREEPADTRETEREGDALRTA